MVDNAKRPLSAFDPRLKKLLLRGAREKFEVPCGTEKKAHQLQSTLHSFRSLVKKHDPKNTDEWEPLYGCVVSKKPDDKSILVLYPKSGEFKDILDKVEGIEPGTLPSDPLEDL